MIRRLLSRWASGSPSPCSSTRPSSARFSWYLPSWLRRAWRSAQRLVGEIDAVWMRSGGLDPTREEETQLAALRRIASLLGIHFLEVEGAIWSRPSAGSRRNAGHLHLRRHARRAPPHGDPARLAAVADGPRACKAGVPVDARIESGRTPIHALRRLWEAEHFDRIVVPAPIGREPGFDPEELLWMLTHAPSETLILRPDPVLHAAANGSADGRPAIAPSLRRVELPERVELGAG